MDRKHSTCQPGSPRQPIIAMMANALWEDRERCMVAGMNGHIANPVNLHALHAELRCVCSMKTTRRPIRCTFFPLRVLPWAGKSNHTDSVLHTFEGSTSQKKHCRVQLSVGTFFRRHVLRFPPVNHLGMP